MRNGFLVAVLAGISCLMCSSCSTNLEGSRIPAQSKIGRPVRVVSISFKQQSLETIASVVDREGARGADLIVLPETWRGQTNESPETLEGPAVARLSELARKHGTYVVTPLDRKDGPRRVNSAVLLDRSGKVAFVYDKVYPYWSEFDLKQKVDVGKEAAVYQTDFGRVGFAICFDVNFPEVWQRLADQGAEMVVWPSAYSAGSSLQAHAINHHYYIVTSTLRADALLYDITGERTLYQAAKNPDTDINVARMTLDLDRGIYHQNFNIPKRDKLLKEHGADVTQEKWMELEQWFVLKAKQPGVSARDLARQYGMEELRDYLTRSRREIDKMRGWQFAEKNLISSAK
jgi:predicted amidohydrolase